MSSTRIWFIFLHHTYIAYGMECIDTKEDIYNHKYFIGICNSSLGFGNWTQKNEKQESV